MKHRAVALVALALLSSSLVRAQTSAVGGEPAAGSAESQSGAASARAQRFDVTVDNAPARAFFQGLVEGTRLNMLVHPEVSGRITLSLKHVTVEEVLEATRELYGYDYHSTAAGFVVLPATIQSRVFHLSYLDLRRAGVSNTRISSGQVTQSGSNSQYGNNTTSSAQQAPSGVDAGGRPLDVTGTSIITRGESDLWTSIQEDLRALLGGRPGRSVLINRESGVIIVQAMPNELHQVSEYLRQTVRAVTRQVVLEAKIIEVDLDNGSQAGINWAAVLQNGSSHYSFFQSTPPNGFAGNPLQPTGAPVTVGPGNPINSFLSSTLGGAFTIAADFPNFSTFIELLSSQGRTRVLSSPRVSTLQNQQAIIKAGTDEFFVTGLQSNTVTGTATSTSNNVQLTPFFSGVALDVTPQIDDDGSVTLHVHPTVSEVTDQTKSLSVNGFVDTIPLAHSQIRESDNIVRARSGQLVIIGGLMSQQITNVDYKTPLLGDLPGLGKLFRSEQHQTHTVELVILLRPFVVGDEDWPAMVSEPAERLQDLNRRGDFGPLTYPPMVPGRMPPP